MKIASFLRYAFLRFATATTEVVCQYQDNLLFWFCYDSWIAI